MRQTFIITVSVDDTELDTDQAMDKRNLQYKMDAAWPLARMEAVKVISVRQPAEPLPDPRD